MALPKLALTPDSSGYSAKFGNEVLSAKLAGGRSRRRRDIIGASHNVSVEWIMTPDEYSYLKLFYAERQNGALPFLMDLILDGPFPLEYEVSLVEDTFKLASQAGATYIVTAELEVVPSTPALLPRQYVGQTNFISLLSTSMAKFNTAIGKWRTPPGAGFKAVAWALSSGYIPPPSNLQCVVYDAKLDGSPGSLLAISEIFSFTTTAYPPSPIESPAFLNPIILASDHDYWLGLYATSISWAYSFDYSYVQSHPGLRTTTGPGIQDPFPSDVSVQAYDAPAIYLRTV